MREIRTKLGQSGRIVIPTEHRRRLGLKAGDKILLHLNEERLHLYTPAQAVGGESSEAQRTGEGRGKKGIYVAEHDKQNLSPRPPRHH